MAARTFAATRHVGKLSLMRISQVAIATQFVRNRFLEIRRLVAGLASQGGVLSFQRVFCFGMIEGLSDLDGLPVRDSMTARTGCAKRSLVRIRMAGRAVLVGEPLIFYVGLRILYLQVTLFARNLFVSAVENKLRCRVVEMNVSLPLGKVMTLITIRRQLPVGSVQILDRQSGNRFRQNMRRLVTVATSHRRVFSFQCVAGSVVVKTSDGSVPVNQVKISPVVIGVTADADPAGRVAPNQ